MPNITLATFAPLFEQRLDLLKNATCQTCNVDPDLKHPLIPWMLGSNFHKTQERIIFVGKPHRGKPGECRQSGIIDPTQQVLGPDGFWNRKWAYWSYTRQIAENLYGTDAAESICFSNLIKCTNTHDLDKTTPEMAVGCIKTLGVIWKEIETIEARTAVFYTYRLYPTLLQEIPFALPGTVYEIKPYEYYVPCGKKRLHWWERSCETAWCKHFRLLVIGHPERMCKKAYVQLLSEWLKTTNNSQINSIS